MGLTKKELISAMVLQSLITKDYDPVVVALIQKNPDLCSSPGWEAKVRAKVALIYAEALLEELNEIVL
jgi:hypothetical protein